MIHITVFRAYSVYTLSYMLHFMLHYTLGFNSTMMTCTNGLGSPKWLGVAVRLHGVE